MVRWVDESVHNKSVYNDVGMYAMLVSRFQARSKDQEILEEGGGAGPSS